MLESAGSQPTLGEQTSSMAGRVRSHLKDNLSQSSFWDKRANKFGRNVNRVKDGEARDKDDYISKMLERIEIRPGWTVLDIGCGPGALDISSEMLKRLKSNADSSGLSNIRYLNSSWQDAFAGNR
jgi:2-polyprenyl-3-methyl-5-hydroxy-6-metoxy-1,4-benzoquinol methylase